MIEVKNLSKTCTYLEEEQHQLSSFLSNCLAKMISNTVSNLLFFLFHSDLVASQSSNYWIQHRKWRLSSATENNKTSLRKSPAFPKWPYGTSERSELIKQQTHKRDTNTYIFINLWKRNPVFGIYAMDTRISVMKNKIEKYHLPSGGRKINSSILNCPKAICMDYLPCRFVSYFPGNRTQKQVPYTVTGCGER